MDAPAPSEKPVSAVKCLWTWLGSLTSSARYLILLVSLETLTWTPMFYTEGSELKGALSWDDLIVVVTLLSGVFAISKRKVVAIASLKLAALALGTMWASELYCTRTTCMASDACLALFLGFVACMILHDIWTARMVTADTLVGAVCAYMLIGATWASAYSFVELLVPGSFVLTVTGETISAKPAAHIHNYPLLMYYSFVTLCSLGYGDVVPVKAAARMVATTEAITGHFYMAVFVARMISLHLVHARASDSAPEE